MKRITSLIAVISFFVFYPLNYVYAAKFSTMFGGSCSTFECWMNKLWAFTLNIAIPLATLIVAAGGVVWATAGDSTERVELGRKLIMGALSGLAVLVLGKLFFVILGISS